MGEHLREKAPVTPRGVTEDATPKVGLEGKTGLIKWIYPQGSRPGTGLSKGKEAPEREENRGPGRKGGA